VRFRQTRSQRQRTLAGTLGLAQILVARSEPLVQRGVHHGQAGEGWRVPGIEPDGALEHRRALVEVRTGHTRQVLPPTQVVLVGRGAGVRARHRLLFKPAQHAAAQRRRDAFRDLVLDGKDVLEGAIEPLRPAVITGLDLDELHRDAQAILRLSHAAFEERTDAELPADLTDVAT
jgi:hypothetical protein